MLRKVCGYAKRFRHIPSIPKLTEFLLKNTELTESDFTSAWASRFTGYVESFREVWICSNEPWIDKDDPIEKLVEKITETTHQKVL